MKCNRYVMKNRIRYINVLVFCNYSKDFSDEIVGNNNGRDKPGG